MNCIWDEVGKCVRCGYRHTMPPGARVHRRCHGTAPVKLIDDAAACLAICRSCRDYRQIASGEFCERDAQKPDGARCESQALRSWASRLLGQSLRCDRW